MWGSCVGDVCQTGTSIFASEPMLLCVSLRAEWRDLIASSSLAMQDDPSTSSENESQLALKLKKSLRLNKKLQDKINFERQVIFFSSLLFSL
jgi:hypothetical protein